MNRIRRSATGRPEKGDIAKVWGFYEKFHSPEYLGLDPLITLQRFSARADIETGGLLASVLAYGRVETIVSNLEGLFAVMEHAPYAFCMQTSFAEKKRAFARFRHRFTTGRDIALFLESVALLIKQYGSIERVFADSLPESGEIAYAIDAFSAEIKRRASPRRGGANRYFDFLVPSAKAGSACKRMNMYLRWMVRPADGIDFGIWKSLHPANLIVPVDTHVAKIARTLGMTRRATADWRMAEEITAWLRHIDRDDPVRFDFSLCRSGMVATRRGAA